MIIISRIYNLMGCKAMRFKCRGNSAVTRDIPIAALGLLLLITVSVSMASAQTIQQSINDATDSPVYISTGTYNENVDVNRPLTIIGLYNPVVNALNPAIDAFKISSQCVVLAGFNIIGATSASGVLVDNVAPIVIFNNIYGNQVGLKNDNDTPVDARHCFWGTNGTGPNRGKPGEAGNNNVTPLGTVLTSPWLTAPVINGKAVVTNNFSPSLDNPEAGIRLQVSGGGNFKAYGGSAKYLSAPYCSAFIPAGLIPVGYYDVVVMGNNGGNATITVTYADLEISNVAEGSLKLYVWDGFSWVQASNILRDPVNNQVQGRFLTTILAGSPIALVGEAYSVTLPAEPSSPLASKPIFQTFTIESVAPITAVYYQIDNYTSAGWKPIQTALNTQHWSYIPWSITDAEWSALSEGYHKIYFKFTRGGTPTPLPIGDDGSIGWQFVKSQAVSSPVRLISPNGGEILNRQPFTISWTMPSPESVYAISLWYSTDSGVTFPYRITTLFGPDTSFSWRSPNIRTYTGRVKVEVMYTDGTIYSDVSDADFTIQKGYSFMAWVPNFEGFRTSFRAWGRQPYSFVFGG